MKKYEGNSLSRVLNYSKLEVIKSRFCPFLIDAIKQIKKTW